MTVAMCACVCLSQAGKQQRPPLALKLLESNKHEEEGNGSNSRCVMHQEHQQECQRANI